MKTAALCLAVLAGLAAARPKFQAPYTLEGRPTAWENPNSQKNPSCTKDVESGFSPRESASYEKKNKYHSYNSVTDSNSAYGTGGYQQTTSTPTYSGLDGGGTPAGGYQQPTITSLSGSSDGGGTGGGSGGSPTPGNEQPTSINSGLGSEQSPAASNPGGASATGTGPLLSSTVASSGKVTLPAGCESKNGLGIGWLPDSDTGVPLTAITSALGGVRPCWAGYYAQITGSTWDGSQLTGKVAQVKAGGALYLIFVASVQPYIEFSVVPAVAPQIASVMEQLTSQGLTVWLRFAHEMNWYDTAAGGSTYKGTPAEFRTAWKAVSDAVKSNPSVLMYWSPNAASAAQLQSEGWFPDQGAIDVIGVDVYPSSGATFADTYASFCGGFGDVPFLVGETGAGSASDKTSWLTQLVSDNAKTTCPNYVGFMWFEYNKELDYRIATNGNTEAASVLGSG